MQALIERKALPLEAMLEDVFKSLQTLLALRGGALRNARVGNRIDFSTGRISELCLFIVFTLIMSSRSLKKSSRNHRLTEFRQKVSTSRYDLDKVQKLQINSEKRKRSVNAARDACSALLKYAEELEERLAQMEKLERNFSVLQRDYKILVSQHLQYKPPDVMLYGRRERVDDLWGRA